VDDVKAMLHTLHRWKVSHVKRDTNFAAQGLAKEATINVIDKIWLEEIPRTIYDIVILKQFALSMIQ
jgi:hypothetical protein